MNLLSAYAWPGNIRELRNTLEKMVVLSRGGKLTARDVPPGIREAVKAAGGTGGMDSTPGAQARLESLAETERRTIRQTLHKHHDNITKAAQDLGISRRTLHRKLKLYRSEETTGSGGAVSL
jgi:DNA-binding NtrC family response regulator